MTQHTPGPWRPTHTECATGGGYFSHTESVKGPDGKDICQFISFVTEFTDYATGHLRKQMAWMNRASFSWPGWQITEDGALCEQCAWDASMPPEADSDEYDRTVDAYESYRASGIEYQQ